MADKYRRCDKLYDIKDVKVRNHYYVTGKYRCSAHQSCNVNFKLISKIPAILYDLWGYDGLHNARNW